MSSDSSTRQAIVRRMVQNKRRIPVERSWTQSKAGRVDMCIDSHSINCLIHVSAIGIYFDASLARKTLDLDEVLGKQVVAPRTILLHLLVEFHLNV